MSRSLAVNRLSIYGSLAVAAAVGGMLAGCGGSSSSSGSQPVISTSGGLLASPGSGTPGTSSGSTPQQVQVTLNGQVITGTLPANETIPASGTVSALPPGVSILTGLTLAPKTRRESAPPTVSHHTQGEIDVDGCDTGLTVTSNGQLSGYLFLVPGQHTITAIGPFAIIGDTAQLNIGQFIFKVTTAPDGFTSIPSSITANLPANGGRFTNGHFVDVSYPTPDFSTGKGTLILQWTGATITKTSNVTNGQATFKALSNSSVVPSTGLGTIEFDYSAN